MLHQAKELPNDSERSLSYHNCTDKKAKWLLLRSRVFPRFLLNFHSSIIIQNPHFGGYQMPTFGVSVNKILVEDIST